MRVNRILYYRSVFPFPLIHYFTLIMEYLWDISAEHHRAVLYYISATVQAAVQEKPFLLTRFHICLFRFFFFLVGADNL